MSKQEDKSGSQSQNKINTSMKINSEPLFQKVLDDARNYVSGYNSDGLPRFGLLSLLAKRIPFFAYDHDSLMNMCDTAFTDNHHVFMSNKEARITLGFDNVARENNRVESNYVFVLLHELSHIARLHFNRMSQFPHSIANIAGDVRINQDCEKFAEITIGNEFKKDLWGMTQEEKDLWSRESEEVIAYHLLAKAKQQEESKQKGQGQGQSGGDGGGEKSKDEILKDIIDKLKDGTGKLQLAEPGASNNHLIDAKDLIEALEEAGLTGVIDKLKLPDSTDKAALGDMANQAANGVIHDSATLTQIRNEHINGKRMPGGHINDAVAEMIGDLTKPKISWKTAVRKMTFGDGLRYEYTDDVQHDICYVLPDDMGISDPIYLGAEIPIKPEKGVILNIWDTSGSVTISELRDYGTEVLGQLDDANADEGASEVIFMSADTAVRGEVITVTKENLDDAIKEIAIYGRGGTTFSGPMNTAFKWAEENEKRIDGMVYWTDLGAPPPIREELPDTIPPIVFMTHSKHLDSGFSNAVSEFAEVHAIDDALTLDFEQLSEDIPAANSHDVPEAPSFSF